MAFEAHNIRWILSRASTEDRTEILRIVQAEVDRDLAKSLGVESVSEIRKKNGAQSMAFMIEMLPHIWPRLEERKRYSSATWLDVGPGAGYGANLLATLHSGTTLGYRLDVSTIDITSRYANLMRYAAEDLNEIITQDIFKFERTFDYVSASHVIEHVPEPVSFVRRLQEMSKDRVFVLTPWKEDREKLTKGHVNIFDEAFIDDLGSPDYQLLESVAWGAFMKPRYKMLFLDLPGLA